jgi:hypothetical protein
MKFKDRRSIEAELRSLRVTTSKMERALDAKYEAVRKLEEELGLAMPSQEEYHADH